MTQSAKVIEFKKVAKPTLTYNPQEESFLLNGELNTSDIDKKRLSKDYQLSYMRILTNRNNGRN